jgi:hypothetical protein
MSCIKGRIGAIVFLKPLLTIYQLYRGDQFLGGGNRDTMRKPPTCRKSLTNLSHNLVEISHVKSYQPCQVVFIVHEGAVVDVFVW